MGLTQDPFIIFLLISSTIMAVTKAQPSSCQRKCGDIDIPYPFGIGEGCFAKEHGDFNIRCEGNSRAFLGNSNNEVLDISLNGELRLKAQIGYECFNRAGENTTFQPEVILGNRTFTFSQKSNQLIVIGCDTQAWIWDREESGYSGGCISYCRKYDTLKDLEENGTCTGLGCCGVSIPRGIRRYTSGLRNYDRYTYTMDFNRCGFLFLVERDKYSFNMSDLTTQRMISRALPVVVDWSIGNQSCESVKNTACISNNSECIKSNSDIGYLCNCTKGYKGNPYIAGSCTDVDECAQMSSICPSNAICTNTIGGYSCDCPSGYNFEPEFPGLCDDINRCEGRCVSRADASLGLKLGLGITGGLLFIVCVGVVVFYRYQRRSIAEHARKVAEFKKRMFEQNGGPLLQQQISSQPGNIFRIFTEEELSKATNNFAEEQIIGKGGHGVVYLGHLEDNTAIAVKKSKMMDERESIEFAREMAILSQINHVNVVKILGCCMEVEIPMLVYEYVSGGTLFEVIHGNKERMSLSLGFILRIVSEVADALSYLHSYASPPILHKDVKTSNILLDEKKRAKISDFGASSFAPTDEGEIATVVQGTCGYLDPEYLQTYQFSEKSDVYSFGVVLVELMTRRKPFMLTGPDDTRSLAVKFVSSLKEGNLDTILDPKIMEDGDIEVLTTISELAVRCLRVNGSDRPSMREVSMSLHLLGSLPEHPWVPQEVEDDTERLLHNGQQMLCDGTVVGDSYVETSNQIIIDIGNGR